MLRRFLLLLLFLFLFGGDPFLGFDVKLLFYEVRSLLVRNHPYRRNEIQGRQAFLVADVGAGVRKNASCVKFQCVLGRHFITGVGLCALFVNTTLAGTAIIALAHENSRPDGATFATSVTELFPFLFSHFKTFASPTTNDRL